MNATIRPDRILRELTELWVSLGKEHEKETSTGVLRACAMTLVVAADEAEDASSFGETLAALMPEHPSRAIVIRLRPAAERDLSARVFAQCWMPFGQRRQICCEQIEITASDASLPDLPAVVLPLAVPDLPVILWCRSPRLFRQSAFPQLSGIAQKVVIDSARFPDPAGVLEEMAASNGSGQILADLSWTRLTRWRELISQIFENRIYLSCLPKISELRIAYTGRRDSSGADAISACYLASWLLDGLRQAGSQARLFLEPTGGANPGELSQVALIARNGRDMHFSIGREEGQAVEIRAGELVSRTIFPLGTDYVLMREELSIPGRDPVYEKTLAGAARLAREHVRHT